MIYKMHLNVKYFNLIKSGIKTIEIRVNDEKRRKLKIGDEINFIKATNFEEIICATIKDLVSAKSFNELCSKIEVSKTGFVDKEELIAKLAELYPEEETKGNGVVAIVIEIKE